MLFPMGFYWAAEHLELGSNSHMPFKVNQVSNLFFFFHRFEGLLPSRFICLIAERAGKQTARQRQREVREIRIRSHLLYTLQYRCPISCHLIRQPNERAVRSHCYGNCDSLHYSWAFLHVFAVAVFCFLFSVCCLRYLNCADCIYSAWLLHAKWKFKCNPIVEFHNAGDKIAEFV